LILSHYWDGLKIGALYNRTLPAPVKHVWTPHSLGAIKKRNVPSEQWPSLRVNERIAVEKSLLGELDGVAATSATIRRSLREDYEYEGAILFLPPAVDDERYHPREVPDDDPVWDFLSQWSGGGGEAAFPPQAIRKCKIVTEISRTVATKRKDVLIEAFAAVQERVPDSLLVVSVDDNQKELAAELRALIRSLDLRHYVATYIPDEVLPALYAITDVYCTASVMEGFGMSAQEAAASGVPIVASHLVPFVTEYLMGDEVEVCESPQGGTPVKRGEGAIVFQADDVGGFACALEMLLTDDDLRAEMGENARRITVPHFTWRNTVPAFLDEIGVSP
jgi:glycosyltransferase involved in cell wall biosynthesis